MKLHKGTFKKLGNGDYEYRGWTVCKVNSATRTYWAGKNENGDFVSANKREQVAWKIDSKIDK